MNRYVALTTRRKEYGICADGGYWTKVVFSANGAASLADFSQR
jgi:hypothetical protein